MTHMAMMYVYTVDLPQDEEAQICLLAQASRVSRLPATPCL